MRLETTLGTPIHRAQEGPHVDHVPLWDFTLPVSSCDGKPLWFPVHILIVKIRARVFFNTTEPVVCSEPAAASDHAPPTMISGQDVPPFIFSLPTQRGSSGLGHKPSGILARAGFTAFRA